MLLGLLVMTTTTLAYDHIIRRIDIENTALTSSGFIEVYELDGSKVTSQNWGSFSRYETKNWTLKIANLGNDVSFVAWQCSGDIYEGYAENKWLLNAYWGYTSNSTFNVYRRDIDTIPLESNEAFYVMFVLSRNGALSGTKQFTISVLDVA